jgi:hypothetical protein
MAGTISRTMPTPEIVRNLIPGSGGTGTMSGGFMGVRVSFGSASTFAWINPESGTVMAQAFVVFTVAGTGTFDMGRSSDGTGPGSGMIDGATMTVGVHSQAQSVGGTASSTLGNADAPYWLVGPGGTGTNNSIVVIHNEATTSTSVGFLKVIYMVA